MNPVAPKEKSADIPLYALSFFCFLSLIFCNTRLTVSKKSPIESTTDKIQNTWGVWKFKKSNVCGLFLKAVIMISTPVISFISTSLLLVGIVKKNMYMYLPWLMFVFKGIFLIQSQNLLDIFESFLETGMGENEWKSFALYFMIIAVDMIECFFLREILKMFQDLWMMGFSKKTDMIEENEESTSKETAKAVET